MLVAVRLDSSAKAGRLRNEVCFWVLRVGRCKTLPPDTATFLHGGAREGNGGFKITYKSLPRITQHGWQAQQRQEVRSPVVDGERRCITGRAEKRAFSVGFNLQSFLV